MKKAMGKSRYELVYGLDVRIKINNLIPIYKFIQECHEYVDDIMKIIIN